jgi:hypothetical protein
MTNSASQLGSEFNAFLFAPIGEGRNGMLLSVLSVLARQDIDPWREAAELAGLPRENAIRRLSSLIAAIPDELPASHDAPTVATRLVALLPRSPKFNVSPRMVAAGPSFLANSKGVITMMIFMAVVLAAQAFLANRFESTQTKPPHLSSASVVTSKSSSQNPRP